MADQNNEINERLERIEGVLIEMGEGMKALMEAPKGEKGDEPFGIERLRQAERKQGVPEQVKEASE